MKDVDRNAGDHPEVAQAIRADLKKCGVTDKLVPVNDYNNPDVNSLIDKALAAADQSTAANDWHQADEQIMKDAATVPLQTQKTALFRSSRVHNATFWPFSQAYDITQVWLNRTS